MTDPEEAGSVVADRCRRLDSMIGDCTDSADRVVALLDDQALGPIIAQAMVAEALPAIGSLRRRAVVLAAALARLEKSVVTAAENER